MISIKDDIKVAGIETDSIVDGPGLRFTIFFQGCPRFCDGCHNPESISFDAGEEYTTEQLLSKIDKNPLIQGVTFSGGEPLSRAKALLPLVQEIEARNLDLAVYTGYTFEEILEDGDTSVLELLSKITVLIDGPFILSQKSLTLPFRGSANQRILDIKQSINEKKAVPISDNSWMYQG